MDILNEAVSETERLLKAATRGPWTIDHRYYVGEIERGRAGGEVIGQSRATHPGHKYDESRDLANTAALVHARNNIGPRTDALVEAVAALEGVVVWAAKAIVDMESRGEDAIDFCRILAIAKTALARIKRKLEGVRDE